MSAVRVWCLLPAERADHAARVAAAGALPVLDLVGTAAASAPGTAAASAPGTPAPSAAGSAVPPGVAVRVADTADAPGDGLVIARTGAALPGRVCWRELPALGPVPEGFAGVVVRTRQSGGRRGEADVRALFAGLPSGGQVVVDCPLPPEEIPPGARILLSDVLVPSLDLGPGLRDRLDALGADDILEVDGFQFVASLVGPARRRLAAGEPAEDLARGWLGADEVSGHLWPVGPGILTGRALARQHGGLEGVVGAYVGPPAPAVVTVAPGVAPTTPGVAPVEELPEFVLHAPVAVVGLGCRLPGASSVGDLWKGLLIGYNGIVEVPIARWDPALYWDANADVPDRTYARIGGFITNFTFHPKRFRIPPTTARVIDPIQQMALEAAADALEDAGYGPERAFNRERVAVILGNSMGGEITTEYTLRVMFPALRRALEEVPGFSVLLPEERLAILTAYELNVKAGLPPITEDSMPGELSNVVAGRITNALNLGGPNFTTDAACAGSMAAIQAAVKGLQDGDFDMAVTGGADRSMGVPTFIKFCKIGALSPDGSRPFDADANGFVMGEGTGIIVLKRLADAERDHDRIYAVLRGVGASSDGKGKGITAPNPAGQARALQRAYLNAGVDPRDVDLFECHGTSTKVGDKVEVDCLSELLGSRARPARIGSIKSNIGHLKSAAGAASILKATLALHHRIYPPSINYRRPRADLALERVPLQVQVEAQPWETDRARFVGVSAFGFGGTNFHLVLEEHRPGERVPGVRVLAPPRPAPIPAPPLAPAPLIASSAPGPLIASSAPGPISAEAEAALRRPSSAIPVPPGIWALSADTPEELVARCRALKRGHLSPFEPDAPLRLAAAAENDAERDQQLDKVIGALQKGKGYDLLRSRGIYLEDVPCDGQLCFVFTGQGSQYVGMGLDLAEVYPVVADTFREADEVLQPLLGRPLTDILRRDPTRSEDDQFEELRATEISQPATLTVDVAILRLLAAYNVRPDVVAGHSLGEYGAAVAAGMMSFRDALVAVSARGREMAAVQLEDFGKMAGIATSVENVESVLAEIPGYVVAANKNCPTQTVIAGESDAVEAASEAFKSRGVTVYPLPVSHAFHSRIVAPASEPLRRVLSQIDLRGPQRRITSNVDSRYYATGEGARERAIDTLARQVASPVEWIAQIERMYADGARIFVECGPKRALSGFVVSILKNRPHRAIYTNQPKRGGVLSFHDGLASLYALGFQVAAAAAEKPDIFAESGPRRSTSALLRLRAESRSLVLAEGGPRGAPAVERAIVQIVANKTGYPVDALDLDFDLEADLGIDTVKQAEIIGHVREHFRLDQDPAFRMGEHRTLRSLIDYAGTRVGATRPAAVPARRAALPEREAEVGSDVAARFLAEVAAKDLRGLDPAAFAEAMMPALQSFLAASWQAFSLARPAELPTVRSTPQPEPPRATASGVAASGAAAVPAAPERAFRIVCSGASLGLPGGREVFDPDNVQSILRGDNRIHAVPLEERRKMADKGLVRLVKDARTGQGEFIPVSSPDEVIRLAGRKADFDLVRDYGVDPALVRSLDITTQLAFAAGLEALRDAGIPLVRTYKATSTGKDVATGWALPASMRDSTGIVFASAFPGYDLLLQKLRDNGGDGEGHFDRRFLFQILAMGHSQFAQLIGARGPNTCVNAACASTTQAISIAEDWLRVGRAERVVVVGADDVTGDQLLEWIGAGFLAAGAATTEDKVENAALPFDRRRHGMILGMGAVGMVLEREADVVARGMVPLAELLGTHISNSAFHGTRLDQAHISAEVTAFARKVVARAGVDAGTFARRCVFLSHETYTPARGGSAAAEMASLPAAFGADASRIVIANTKGYTGHAMGAGIEDAVAVKALQYRLAPPIANLKEPDPELGQLSLSRGGPIDVDYALRLSAGFGSQLALAAWKRIAEGDKRVADPARNQAWLAREAGPGALVVEHRQLRYVESREPHVAPAPTAPAPFPGGPAQSEGARVSEAEVLATLLKVVAARTGYEPSELDPQYELEADLGIDTVKQAEIFSEVRERYGLGRDDNFRLADHPTIARLASYLASRAEGPAPSAPAAAPPAAAGPVSSQPAPPAPGGGARREEVFDTLLRVIAARTGYEPSELDPNYELEADLGIDTVKQAEIFSEVRERFGLGRDDNFRLADFPTITKLAGYLADRAALVETPPPAALPGMAPTPAPGEPAHPLTADEPPRLVTSDLEALPEGGGPRGRRCPRASRCRSRRRISGRCSTARCGSRGAAPRGCRRASGSSGRFESPVPSRLRSTYAGVSSGCSGSAGWPTRCAPSSRGGVRGSPGRLPP